MEDNSIYTFPCPFCGESQEAESSWQGLKGQCYACEHSFKIPECPPYREAHSRPIPDTCAKNEPPPYEATVADRIIDLLMRGRYSRVRQSKQDRTREHIHLLHSKVCRKKEGLCNHRQALVDQSTAVWKRLEHAGIRQALDDCDVEILRSLEGVGPGTIDRLREAGLNTALDLIHNPEKLEAISRIKQKVKIDIIEWCGHVKDRAEQSYYPVFTDKADDSQEMHLLKLHLDIEQIDEAIALIDQQMVHFAKAVKRLPRFTFLGRLLRHPADSLTGEEQQVYEQAIWAEKLLATVGIPDRGNEILSQDEYIRAIGLIGESHPRPVDEAIERGRGSNRGNPILSSLRGFSRAERKQNEASAEERDQRNSECYRDAAALHSIAGDRALSMLCLPREKALVSEIEAFPLNESGMNDIILRNYQRFAAKFILSRKKVIIGDEMGLGKTIQALCVISHVAEEARTSGSISRFLVIGPASIRCNWAREIERFTDIPVLTLAGKSCLSTDTWLREGGIGLTSYECLKLLPKPDIPVDVCIIDEAQYIKNPDAKRTLTCRDWLNYTTHAVCMTGTPIENNLEEFLSIFDAVKPGIARELRALLLQSDDPVRFSALIQSIYLRRNKGDVLQELPPLNIIPEQIELSQEELDLHQKHIEDGDVHFMSVRQNLNNPDISGASKWKRAMTLIAEYRENKRNVIVFTYFRDPIEWFKECLPDAFIIHGGIPPNKRQETIDLFSQPLENSSNGRLLVAQIKSGGVGLNIQAASAVILLEPQFNPAVEIQAISRVHRMGQRHSVDVHRLISQGTIEEDLLERLYQKQEIMDLYGADSYLKKLTGDAVDRRSARTSYTEDDLRKITSLRLREQQRIAS